MASHGTDQFVLAQLRSGDLTLCNVFELHRCSDIDFETTWQSRLTGFLVPEVYTRY